MIQNLAIASDHAGYKLKNYIANNLKREIIIKDFGTNNKRVLLKNEVVENIDKGTKL